MERDIPDHQARRLKAKFREFRDADKNHDGALDCREFWSFLKKGDPSFSLQEAKTLFSQLDSDKDGRIKFDDLVDFLFKPDKSSDQYTDMSSIKAVLKTGSVVLLRDDWLLDLYHSQGVLPRRQDLPEGAVWTGKELLSLQVATRQYGKFLEWEDLSIISISYCWLTKRHPDPDGWQLATFIGPLLELFREQGRRAAIFIDWCSLHQEPRSHHELRMFKAALKHINLWYAHKQTMVWMLTSTPPGVTRYMDRGWPYFERAISSMICDSDIVLDLGTGGIDLDAQVRYSDVRKHCISARPPPMTPEKFELMLRTKRFTNGADKDFVAAKYAQTFCDVMGCAEDLNFSKLQWSDADLPDLCEALPFCHRLQRLSLAGNHIHDDTLLSQYISTGASCLEELNLAGNDIKEISIPLCEALKSSSVLLKLNLAANGIQNIDLLGEMLVVNNTLQDLDLSSNRIVDLSAFCQGLAENVVLQQLHLELNRIQIITPLARALEQNRALRGLDLRANNISAESNSQLQALWRAAGNDEAELAF